MLTKSFVFDGKAKFIGFGQEMDTVFVSERKGVTSNTILIDKSYLDNLIPVEIRTGTIAFDNGVSATSVYFEREDERHTELAEFTVKSATQPLTVFMNPEVSYRTRLAYAIPTQMYLNTPTNKNAVSIVSNATESNDVVINQPAKGIHKIYPVYGELTFSMGVEGIIVNLKQGEKKLTPIPLMKSKPAVCLLVDYEPGEPQEIQVESVTVIRKDETGRITQEPFTPSQTVLRPEDTELVLDIF